MPWNRNDFQHTRAEAYSALVYDKYGQEHDEELDGLVNLENGVRKYWADQLRNLPIPTALDLDTVAALADLLDPYSDQDGENGAFARTTLEGDEGAKQAVPNDED